MIRKHTRREALGAGLALTGTLLLPRAGAQTPPQQWVKSPLNPMLSLGAAGEFDSQNIFAPSAVKWNDQYYLFYSGGPSGPANGGDFVNYQLGLARSIDGSHWLKTGAPLLTLGTRDDFHATPALLRDASANLLLSGNLWHMVFCGNRADDVEHATSPDGLVWTKDAQNPIYHSAYAPHLLSTGSQLRLYYVHKPATGGWQIHLATGPDLYSLQAHPSNPMLVLSQPWEATAMIYPYVLKEGDTWIMFYASYWATTPLGTTSTAIGMATSADGIAWTKATQNPVLKPTAGSAYDSVYTSSQCVIRDGDHYKMYYAGRINMLHKYYAIALATWDGDLLDTTTDVGPGWRLHG